MKTYHLLSDIESGMTLILPDIDDTGKLVMNGEKPKEHPYYITKRYLTPTDKYCDWHFITSCGKEIIMCTLRRDYDLSSECVFKDETLADGRKHGFIDDNTIKLKFTACDHINATPELPALTSFWVANDNPIKGELSGRYVIILKDLDNEDELISEDISSRYPVVNTKITRQNIKHVLKKLHRRIYE